jgi:hypothetical protein
MARWRPGADVSRPEVIDVTAKEVRFGDHLAEGQMVFLVEVQHHRWEVGLYLGTPEEWEGRLSMVPGSARYKRLGAHECLRVMRGIPVRGDDGQWLKRVDLVGNTIHRA